MASTTPLSTATDSSTFARTALTSTRPKLKPPFKLKPLPESGYPGRACAAKGCDRPSDVIDGTYRFWDEDVPLCDDCNALRPDPELRPPDPEPIRGQTEDAIMLDDAWLPQMEVEVEQDEKDKTLLRFTAKPKSFKLFG